VQSFSTDSFSKIVSNISTPNTVKLNWFLRDQYHAALFALGQGDEDLWEMATWLPHPATHQHLILNSNKLAERISGQLICQRSMMFAQAPKLLRKTTIKARHMHACLFPNAMNNKEANITSVLSGLFEPSKEWNLINNHCHKRGDMKEPRDIAFLFDIMKSIMSIFIIFRAGAGGGWKRAPLMHAPIHGEYFKYCWTIGKRVANACDKCNIRHFSYITGKRQDAVACFLSTPWTHFAFGLNIERVLRRIYMIKRTHTRQNMLRRWQIKFSEIQYERILSTFVVYLKEVSSLAKGFLFHPKKEIFYLNPGYVSYEQNKKHQSLTF
jgi:hypothetical protein